MGRSKPEKLERLIGEVSRGERTLAGINDPELREAVRVALRLHKESNDVSSPDEYTRIRMRARVMAGLRPRPPTLRDNAWTAWWYLGRPAPYIVRAVAISALIVSVGMGATVASADSLPDDLFYPMKLAAEGVRLGLAGAPADRAAVELSIAEHRLVEAEKLATTGRAGDALVASAIYSAHIAAAAAELSAQDDSSVAGAQLESSFKAQRDRAQRLAEILATDVSSARGAQVLAMIAAPTMAPGLTGVERVAETAASLATDLADAAEDEADAEIAFQEELQDGALPDSSSVDAAHQTRAPFANSASTSQSGTPRRTADAKATTRGTTATPRATPRATQSAHASDNAKAARRAADQARAAAEKLKQALQRIKDKKDHR